MKRRNTRDILNVSFLLLGFLLSFFAICPVLIKVDEKIFDFLTSNSTNNISLTFGLGFIGTAIYSYFSEKEKLKKDANYKNQMKVKILYEFLVQTRYWLNMDNKYEQFENILDEDYIMKLVECCKEAKMQGTNFMLPEEYENVNIIEGNIQSINSEILERLNARILYSKYKDVFQRMLINDSCNMNMAYIIEQNIVESYNISNEIAYDIGIIIVLFNMTIVNIRHKLEIFSDVEAD